MSTLNIFKASIVCQETQLFLVKSSTVKFSTFKKKNIVMDKWCLVNTRYKNLSKRKQADILPSVILILTENIKATFLVYPVLI